MHRAALVAASTVGAVLIAMIIEIMLARRGIGLLDAWQGAVRSGGSPLRGALAWWAITIGAFVAGFVIAMIASRFAWLYLRWLRWVAVGALTFGLAMIVDLAPPVAAAVARPQALATLAALAVAMVMAAFGAFFAARH
jgi:hypothetical protein